MNNNNNNKKRPFESEDKEQIGNNKQTPPKEEMDTPTKQLLNDFFNLTSEEMKKEEVKDDGRIKINKFYMIQTTEQVQQEQIAQRSLEEQDQRLVERILQTELGSSTLKNISDDMRNNFNDGKRIFVNRLRFYPEKAIQEHMISFKQLLYKDLGFKNKLKGDCEVKAAILSTMVFEIEMLEPLLKLKIPMTVFLERNKEDKGPLIEYATKINTNFIFQSKFGALGYGIFHSKIILYEFDDRLRIIIPSANLYTLDWEMLSQVIWFQDFFPVIKANPLKIDNKIQNKSQEEEKKEETKTSENDFKDYLIKYMESITPKGTREVFRQKIDLNKYDLSTAQPMLIASINGRFSGKDKSRYGQNRFSDIVKGKISSKEKTITYQTSSLGKLIPKFMTSLYEQFGHHVGPSHEIQNNFKIIFPTEGYVQSSHLTVANASSIILNEQYWYGVAGFPRKSFCRQVGKSKDLDNNLYHAKFMIVTEKGKEDQITDETVLYFGSHNFSGGAWGNLEKDSTQIAISNWEIGVVFGPKEGSKNMKQKMVDCMVLKYPPQKYKEGDYPFLMR